MTSSSIELGSLSSRVSALAIQAPVVQQPTQQVVRYEPQGQICVYKQQTMVPLHGQGAFTSHMDYLQESGIIRAVPQTPRDGAVLQEPGWHRRPAVHQVSVEGPRTQVMPRVSGGMSQEQIPVGHVYYEEGAQTAGASTSTGLAA